MSQQQWNSSYSGPAWTYPLRPGDAAEVHMGTWIPCRIRTTLSTGNMIVGGPGYFVEYRTQNGDMICHAVRREYVRKPGDEYWDRR